MPLDLANILAAKDEDPTMKIVFFAIFAVIWVVGAIAKAASSKKEQARREQVRRELEESRKTAPDWGEIANRPASTAGGSMPPLPPRPHTQPTPAHRASIPQQRSGLPSLPPQQVPQQPQQVRVPPIPQRKQQQPQKQKKKQRPPVFAQQTLEQPKPPLPPASAAPPKVTLPRRTEVDAAQLRLWLNPATLRAQFMLTEILRPPLALRPRDD